MNQIDTYLDRVIEGDCLEVLQEFPDACIDLILCDLPYGTTTNEWDTIIDLSALWQQYKRIVKPNGVIALTASSVFTAKLILSNDEWFKYKIVWIKSKATNFLNAKKQPLRKHEDICIFYKNQPLYQPQMLPGDPYDKGWRKDQETGCYGRYKPALAVSSGGRYPYDIVCYNEDVPDWFYCTTTEHEGDGHFHPTQKPVELGRFLIRTFTLPGQVVLDNACGSGSFLVSAIMEDRRFIGIEKNKDVFYKKIHPVDFVAISNERISRALRLQKEKLFSG